MNNGQIGILNVGAGDTKLTFDKNNPAERIRAARIVKDMLRRGYALLIEVPDGKGGTRTERVQEFREDTCEYIIADFDSLEAAKEDGEENGQGSENEKAETPVGATVPVRGQRGRQRRGSKAVDAAKVSGVAVGRTSGG